MPLLQATPLRLFTTNIFRAAGVPDATANHVANALVEADLAGHDSHGVIRITEYLQAIQKREIVPDANPSISRETETTLLVDGHKGFGQVIATWTMERAIAKAATQNVAAAGIFNCGHVGRAGVYPEMAAARGFLALAFVNGGGKQPRVAPFGGSQAVFGTNPIAAAIPVAGRSPLVMDFSTAMAASGKIRVARDKGELLPEGWILDRHGRPSRQPKDYYDGGMLLTAAGHKGSALSLLVEVLGGLLTGAGAPGLPQSGYEVGNGVFFIIVNVEAFRPLAKFISETHELADEIKRAPVSAGQTPVLLPNEPETLSRDHRNINGIPVTEATWQSILGAAQELGINPGDPPRLEFRT